MNIINFAYTIKNEYMTSCPFKICKQLKIKIMFLDLGEIKGFYKKCLEQDYIVLNENLKDFDKIYTCAHELGHYFLHSDSNTQTLLTYSKYQKHGKYEIEANLFATHLLFDENIM